MLKRLLLFGLAAAGAYWWFTRFPEDETEAPKLPAGVRLVEDASEVAASTAPSSTVVKKPQAADKPKAPRSATAAAPKASSTTPSVPAKPGKAASKRVDGKRDDLMQINGIGKVFAQRLYDAGIYTFRDLAAQTPERLREITQAKEWQKVDPQTWIDQARQQSAE
jgi:predicted flap endonuclease-1-like 5' DNA nuclease